MSIKKGFKGVYIVKEPRIRLLMFLYSNFKISLGQQVTIRLKLKQKQNQGTKLEYRHGNVYYLLQCNLCICVLKAQH